MHDTIISLLESFEIIYRMRTGNDERNDDQMFFVPSLLTPLSPQTTNPAIDHWTRMDAKYVEFHLSIVILIVLFHRQIRTRKFGWDFFPTGFFSQMLLRLVHLRMQVLACWLNAAVIMGKTGSECAILQLQRGAGEENRYYLEV